MWRAGIGFFTSSDGGATWREIGHRTAAGIDAVPRAGAGPLAARFPLLGTADWGVAWSGSAGAHWRIGVEPGLNGGTVQLLRFHPLRPDTVYVALGRGERSFRSTDGGRSWQPFARSLSADGLSDLAFEPTDPRTLFAARRDGIWKSVDGGGTWGQVSRMGASQLAILGPGTCSPEVAA